MLGLLAFTFVLAVALATFAPEASVSQVQKNG